MPLTLMGVGSQFGTFLAIASIAWDAATLVSQLLLLKRV